MNDRDDADIARLARHRASWVAPEPIMSLSAKVKSPKNTPLEEPVEIILVDDDVAVLGLIEDVLQKQPHIRLETYHDSERAFRRLGEKTFEIMITDLKMPKYDGLQLLHELRRLNRDTMVVIITGYATMESCLEAMRFGAYDYMTKPFRLDEFTHTIQNCVDRVTLKRRMRQMEGELKETRALLNLKKEENTQLRLRIIQLQEQNAARQQMLQRAGIAMRPPAAAPKAAPASYPKYAERPSDLITRKIDRLTELEQAGAISSEEAERKKQELMRL